MKYRKLCFLVVCLSTSVTAIVAVALGALLITSAQAESFGNQETTSPSVDRNVSLEVTQNTSTTISQERASPVSLLPAAVVIKSTAPPEVSTISTLSYSEKQDLLLKQMNDLQLARLKDIRESGNWVNYVDHVQHMISAEYVTARPSTSSGVRLRTTTSRGAPRKHVASVARGVGSTTGLPEIRTTSSVDRSNGGRIATVKPVTTTAKSITVIIAKPLIASTRLPSISTITTVNPRLVTTNPSYRNSAVHETNTDTVTRSLLMSAITPSPTVQDISTTVVRVVRATEATVGSSTSTAATIGVHTSTKSPSGATAATVGFTTSTAVTIGVSPSTDSTPSTTIEKSSSAPVNSPSSTFTTTMAPPATTALSAAPVEEYTIRIEAPTNLFKCAPIGHNRLCVSVQKKQCIVVRRKTRYAFAFLVATYSSNDAAIPAHEHAKIAQACPGHLIFKA